MNELVDAFDSDSTLLVGASATSSMPVVVAVPAPLLSLIQLMRDHFSGGGAILPPPLDPVL
jgi:hypothetical protein